MATTFESESCSRCGGSGKYSFNHMDGDRCYGCGGTGLKLTARGSAARKLFEDSMEKVVKDLQVGDKVFTHIGLSSNRVWQTIAAIEEDTLNVGQNRVTLRLTRKGKPSKSYGLFWDSKIFAMRTTEERDAKLAEALAYQETLTKAGKPAKRATKKEA